MSKVLNFIRFEETKRERAFKEEDEEEEKGESQDVEKCTKRERERVETYLND